VKKKILLISLALVLAISMGIVGCTTPSEEEEEEEEEPTGPQGTLVIARASLSHETFLPWTGGAIEKNYLSGTIYESLTLRDRDGNMLPCLATDWDLSEDGKTWTVTLLSGIHFHDAEGNDWGTMTSEDVKYTFERLMGEDSISHIKGSLTGGNGIESIETNGDYEVLFHLKGPNVAFMNTCTGPDMNGVVCKAYLDQYGDEVAAANPVGTGPYVKDKHVVGGYIQLRAIDDYENHWRMGGVWLDATKYFEYIKLVVVQEVGARVIGLLSGDYDMVEIGAEVVNQVEGEPGVAVLPDIEVILATDVIRFGGLDKLDEYCDPPRYDPDNPWADNTIVGDTTAGVLVRRAMNLAIDREEMVDTIYEGVGIPAVASMSIPEWMTTLTAYDYDTTLAEDLLDDAGYPRSAPDAVDRFSITLIADERYSAEIVTLAVADYWEAVGIDVTIENRLWSNLRPAWAAGELNTGYAWTHRTPPTSLDPMLAINMAFDPTAVLGDYSDEETEALRTAIAQELDPAQRTQYVKDLGAYAHDAATQIFLVAVYGPIGVSTELAEPRDVFDLKENIELIHRK
jgi:peptide/nickel transport system substrate-binding protein